MSSRKQLSCLARRTWSEMIRRTSCSIIAPRLRRLSTSMPKIYDCFTYFNEDLLLSLRLHTLDRVVDRFVVAESTHTFRGKPKPIHFDPARFPEFRDRITHVVVDDMPTHLGDAWANEAHQRNALLRGLTDAASDDCIMISDVDEKIGRAHV